VKEDKNTQPRVSHEAPYGNPASSKGGMRTGTICNSRQCADLPTRPNLSMSKAAMPFLKANSAFYAPLLFLTSGASKDAQQFLRLIVAALLRWTVPGDLHEVSSQ
jgi:hypothetical protein